MRPSARCAFLDRPSGLMSERQLVTMAMIDLKSPCNISKDFTKGVQSDRCFICT